LRDLRVIYGGLLRERMAGTERRQKSDSQPTDLPDHETYSFA
jgi:hypothetical protein